MSSIHGYLETNDIEPMNEIIYQTSSSSLSSSDFYFPEEELANKIFKKETEQTSPTTTTFELSKKNSNLQLRPDPSVKIVSTGPWNNSTIHPDICNKMDKEIQDFMSKMNENNKNQWLDNILADHFSDTKKNTKVDTQSHKQILQIVLTKLLTNLLEDDETTNHFKIIDDVFTKMRILYDAECSFHNHDNNNIKKINNKIIFINHEDDTTVPALQIDNKYMDYIFAWYETCNLILDIEETDIYIPNEFTSNDLNKILYQTLNCKCKDDYLNIFIPTSINHFYTQKKIERLNQQFIHESTPPKEKNCLPHPEYCIVHSSYKQKKTNDNLKKLLDAGIKIPNNLSKEDEKEKEKEKEIISSETIMSSFFNKPSNSKKDVNLFREYKVNEPNDCVQPNESKFSFDCETVLCDFEHKVDINNLVIVLINMKYLQTITIKKANADVLHIIEHYPEFGFIQLFGIFTNNQDIVDFIYNEYNDIQFQDVEEINKKLLVTSQYIDYSIKHETVNIVTMSEENIVKKFIEKNFILDDNIEHKMKASAIYDIVINSRCVDVEKNKLNGFKNRLSKYFKDLHLQKKRYNDGYYYYGIQKRFENGLVTDDELNKFIFQRQIQIMSGGVFVEKPPPEMEKQKDSF